VRQGTKYGILTSTGKVLVKPKYSNIEPFYKSDYHLACITYKDKNGFINDKGKIAITPQYDQVGSFKEGLIYVKKNGKAGFIDKKGKVVIKLIYF
jgi:hypothetical protein